MLSCCFLTTLLIPYYLSYLRQTFSLTSNFRRKLFYTTKIYNTNSKQFFWITPGGLNIEVLFSKGLLAEVNETIKYEGIWSQIFSTIIGLFQSTSSNIPAKRPPILFVHGSFHGAWCWSEYFFEYFNKFGYDCYALSLRGTSSTGLPPGDTSTSIQVEQHVSDVSYALQTVREQSPESPNPILVAHSFGGLITMKLLEEEKNRVNVSAVAVLCSVPPSGNGKMTSRYMQTRLLDSFRILWGLALKGATLDAGTCRALFFDDNMSNEDVNRYMRNFQADSRVGLDLLALAKVLPSLSATTTGRAPWVVESSEQRIPVFVAGAAMDAIVDEEGTAETGVYFGVTPVSLPLPHDVMLCTDWKIAAEALRDWLDKSVK